MARMRMIKPDAPKDEELARLSIEARYLFVFLPCLADRKGRLEDRPRVIKLCIFPWDDIDVDALLEDLNPKFIKRYEVNGRKYIQIVTFEKHQHPHLHEPDSTIPPCPKSSTDNVRTSTDNVQPRPLITESESESESESLTESVYRPSRAFIPPTVEEVRNYCIERKNSIDANHFVDHYTTNGWMRGKNHIKDWRACVRTWETKDEKNRRIVGAAAPVPGKYDKIDKGEG